MKFPHLYLASQSPRRHQLLQLVSCPFTPLHLDVDESMQGIEIPVEYAERLAIAKAQAGWEHPTRVEQYPVLGADTIVVHNGQVFGKPRDKQHGLAMLNALSGQTHTVITAMALCQESRVMTAISESYVTFTNMSEQDCIEYWESGESLDKAGAYALQGMGSLYISELRGSYSGVMGLPLFEFHQLIQRFQA